MLKDWRQLFLSVIYFIFIGAGLRDLFILIPPLYIHEVPTKHPRVKILDPEIPIRKN